MTPLIIGIILLSGGTIPAISFTTASIDRGAAPDVVDDPNGAVGLDVAESVRRGQVDPLVNVTNSVGAQLTVTVALQDGTDGDLTLTQDDANMADQVSFTLEPGTTTTVYLEASTAVGETIFFDVTARSTDVSFDASGRSTLVDPAGGGGPPGGGPQGGA